MTEYIDNTIIEWNHCPQLSFDKRIPKKFNAIMIGWIGSKILNKGVLDKNLVEFLRCLSERQYIDQGWLGYHECEIGKLFKCNFKGRGEFILIHKNNFYVMPTLIIHYITIHQYLPPENFINDLRNEYLLMNKT